MNERHEIMRTGTGEFNFVREIRGGFPEKVWLELKYDG